eukprot:Nk52_evm7s2640 gene=Nk52_evmTU7s2640
MTDPPVNGKDESEPSLLVLILCLDGMGWESDNVTVPLAKALNSTLIFINCYLLLNKKNQVCVIVTSGGESSILYSNSPHFVNKALPEEKVLDGDSEGIYGQHHEFAAVDSHLYASLKGLETILSQKKSNTSSQNGEVANSERVAVGRVRETPISGALTMAQCFVNRCLLKLDPESKLKPRIFLLTASTDYSQEYISVMNCIFASQKQYTPIDVCCATKEDSTLLQQAADLTNGVYIRIPNSEGFVQFLLTVFLADQDARKNLILPDHEGVDYRASCFCHNEVVDQAFVCSVCLSSKVFGFRLL